ncbi:MAG: ATPase domain-containing protein [Candidatus Diapherotrites archaeon]
MPKLKAKTAQGKEIPFGDSFTRLSTGVKGFDELVEGGVLQNSLVLVSGPAGTGKSTFCMHFLVEGAKKGENGLYVSLENPPAQIQREAAYFGWPVQELLETKKLSIVKPELYDFDKLVGFIEDEVIKNKAQRVVIDSSTLIGLYFKDEFKVRKAMVELEGALKRLNVTVMAVNETPEGSDALSTYGVEEFVADGVIMFYMQKKENVFARGVAVRKMRSTKHSLKIHPMQIARPGGIIVYPSEEVFTEF